MKVETTKLKKEYALSIYNTLDFLNGIISEQDWDGLDRYSNNSWEMYNGLLNTLHFLNLTLYQKAVQEAISYGIVNKN